MRKTYKYIVPVIVAVVWFGTAAATEKVDTDSLKAMPWGKRIELNRATSGAHSYTQEQIEKYPTADLRNSLTGIIPGLEVLETSGDIMPFGTSNVTSLSMNSNNATLISRNFSSILCIVDDVPVPFNQLLLDPNQIESITMLSDVADKATFGPLASSGALYIKTKYGRYNTPTRIHVDVESGVETVDRFPGWANGQQYAALNNYARSTTGYQTLYKNVDAYAANDPYSLQYPNVDYRSLMFRNTKPMTKIGVRVDGGTKTIGYNISINGTRDEGIYKVGPDNSFNKLNFLSRVSTKIGRYVEASVGFIGTLSFLRDNSSSFTSFRATPAIAFPLTLGVSGEADENDDLQGTTIYGVSRTFTNNPYAQLVEGGFSTTRSRNGMFNAAVDFDLSWLLSGLKSRTFVNLNTFYSGVVAKSNDYLAYYWDASLGGQTEISDHKGVKASGKSLGTTSTYQEMNFYEKLSYDYAKHGHALTLDATFYLSSSSQNRNSSNFERQQNLIMSGNYSFKERYVVEAVAQLAGSSRFSKANRYCWFPSVGAAWIASNENFLKESNWVDYLKVRAQAGIIGASDVFSTDYLYDADYSLSNGMRFGPVTSNLWFGNNYRTSKYTTINRMANPDLSWEKLHQVDVGVDARLFGHLSVGVNYFRIRRDGIIADITASIPDMRGWSGISVYDNYNSTLTQGGELALRYSGRAGDWRFSVGGSASYYTTKYERYFADTYAYADYQKRVGTSTDTYWGYVCTGKYTSQEQIDNGPTPLSAVKVGDLIYKDLNGDHIIDDKDTEAIGNTQPKLRYAVNINVAYRNFDLTVVGTGRASYQIAMTNDYFWNGWGDGNYSNFVLENWGGDYPRISYDKITSNFQGSTFWLRDGGFFKIQNVELGYNVPLKKGNAAHIGGLRVFARGANLLTISKIKDVDPEYINSGVSAYPLFRTFTAGVKLTF